jgi:deazaflavin-dependent oxidoreductase (nitroreductase family)
LWYLLRAPVHLYRWRLGWLLGHRILLLTHTGRRTGLRRQTVLEVVEYRKDGPEVVVVNGFGADSDWVRNIEATPHEEVTVGSLHFVASHRLLGEEEAKRVIQGYEHRNRYIAPIVRRGLSWLLGWKYGGSESDRQRLVRQLPLIAFRPRVEWERWIHRDSAPGPNRIRRSSPRPLTQNSRWRLRRRRRTVAPPLLRRGFARTTVLHAQFLRSRTQSLLRPSARRLAPDLSFGRDIGRHD